MTSLTCRELIQFLDDYFAGSLPPPQKAVFDRHLSICQACKDYLKTYADTVELVRRACDESHSKSVAADVPEDLIRAILNATSPNNGPL